MNVPLPRALPGRSLAELGFLVPSNLPQGRLEPRHSAPSKRGLQHGCRPVRCAALFNTRVFHFARWRRLARFSANDGRRLGLGDFLTKPTNDADPSRHRFESGRRNFDTTYSDAVDDWVLFDNSDVKPIEMARSQAP